MHAYCGQLFFDNCFDVTLFKYNIQTFGIPEMLGLKTRLLLATQQNKKSWRPLSHAVVYVGLMNNAVRMRIGRRREDASLSFEHLTSEWTWTDCISLLWQTHPSLDCVCVPGREPAILILGLPVWTERTV